MSKRRERVFINGKVFTGRDEADFASGFAIKDGKFARVWDARAGGAQESSQESSAREFDSAEVIDLGGRTVLPGFVDVHTHPGYLAMSAGAVPCTVPVVHDIAGMIEALRRHPNYGRGAAAWIEGFGYDESKLAERRTPTREDLDRVSRTQPVYVLRSDCHSGICNSRALELAGITRDTPDPEVGHFGRFADGEPNGVLQEHGANDVVLDRDIFTVEPDEIAQVRVAETWIRGERVYERR